jgi:hypothetical protein
MDPMTKTVTALFHSEQHAVAAASHLEQAGIPRDRIDIWSTPHNLAPLLEDKGVSRSDAYAYVEGVIRGGFVIIVSCANDRVDQVISILDQEGVLDLDEQQNTLRSEGQQERAAEGLADSLRGSSSSAEASTGAGDDLTGSPDMTLSRTDMALTDQFDQVGHGRVRIHSRKEERPVQE